MMRRHLQRLALLFAFVVCLVAGCDPTPPMGKQAGATNQAANAFLTTEALPPEARDVIGRVLSGATFTHPRDGVVFHNRERLLPPQPKGYYREYTIPTPGARNRGARRLVTGGTPPAVFYYTDDHYRSFRRIEIGSP